LVGGPDVVRLNIIVEGQTERAFVQRVLAPHLWSTGVFASPIIVQTSARSIGGVVTYGKVRRAILNSMKQQTDALFTTMFDLYGLPDDWPGWHGLGGGPEVYDYVRELEVAFAEDIGDRRFIPYMQVHEFEALLLAQPAGLLAPHPDAEDAVAALAEAVSECGGPELVDGGRETHPSARIARLIARYRKPFSGPEAAIAIGIEAMRDACPHFREWVDTLVALGN